LQYPASAAPPPSRTPPPVELHPTDTLGGAHGEIDPGTDDVVLEFDDGSGGHGSNKVPRLGRAED
jgi:hypothetical protein